MFVTACNQIRASIYGINGLSQLGPTSVNASSGTGFMISPTFLITAAHLCHVDNDPTKARHQIFEAIRSPDVGQPMESATFVAEDTQRDVALLKLSGAPRSNACVTLEVSQIPSGTPCGSLGFPLASVSFSPTGRAFNLQERFPRSPLLLMPEVGNFPITRLTHSCIADLQVAPAFLMMRTFSRCTLRLSQTSLLPAVRMRVLLSRFGFRP